MNQFFNQSLWLKVKSPEGNEEYVPKLINIDSRQLKIYENRRRKMKRLLIILLLLLILSIIAIILLSILLPILLNRKKTNTIIIIDTNLTTTTTTTTTRRVFPSTTAVICIYPYVRNSNGRCVNILVDGNNCGSIGNQCLNNSTCSAGVCANVPGIQLNNSHIIWSSASNGSADDLMFNVVLPWSISIYNETTNRITVTTDGVICFDNCSTAYTESRLPSNAFGGVTLFPYWDDLYIYENTSQGIYYDSVGEYPSRQLQIEYYTSHYLQENEYYHFQIIFYENQPGLVEYIYFEATDGGDTCTIGVQASSTGPYISYAYDQGNAVQTNLILLFNTNYGNYSRSSLK